MHAQDKTYEFGRLWRKWRPENWLLKKETNKRVIFQIIVILNFAFQRIKLFNAYAMEKMCDAGIPVLDIYQISASYPQGTFDGIHYPHFVFYPAEDALERYFTTWSRTVLPDTHAHQGYFRTQYIMATFCPVESSDSSTQVKLLTRALDLSLTKSMAKDTNSCVPVDW